MIGGFESREDRIHNASGTNRTHKRSVGLNLEKIVHKLIVGFEPGDRTYSAVSLGLNMEIEHTLTSRFESGDQSHTLISRFKSGGEQRHTLHLISRFKFGGD